MPGDDTDSGAGGIGGLFSGERLDVGWEIRTSGVYRWRLSDPLWEARAQGIRMMPRAPISMLPCHQLSVSISFCKCLSGTKIAANIFGSGQNFKSQ